MRGHRVLHITWLQVIFPYSCRWKKFTYNYLDLQHFTYTTNVLFFILLIHTEISRNVTTLKIEGRLLFVLLETLPVVAHCFRNYITNGNAICGIWVANATHLYLTPFVVVTFMQILIIGTNIWLLHMASCCATWVIFI
jgi:hypothetical protein